MHLRSGLAIAVVALAFVAAGCGGGSHTSVPSGDHALQPQLNGGAGSSAQPTLYVAGQGAVYAYDLSVTPSPDASPVSKTTGYYYEAGNVNAQIAENLSRFHLLDVMNELTATLPYGKQRLLEIAVAIAAKPRVLLLDEPAAGVPESERHDILAAVAALPRDVTVLLIEHDMDLVFSFADRISVLVNGALLVEGPPGEVARDPQVKAVYLGEAANA